MKSLDRMLLLFTGLLSSYQIAVGFNDLATLPTLFYTVAFGVILVAVLLLIILDFEVLNSPVVTIVTTIIPLSLSLGLVWEYLPAYQIPYLFFAILGFAAILITRSFPMPGNLAVIVLSIVHGVSGTIIFVLPILFAFTGQAQAGFALVGLGGALISIDGLLLSLIKSGRPIISRDTTLKILPALLLVMTAAYAAGFALR